MLSRSGRERATALPVECQAHRAQKKVRCFGIFLLARTLVLKMAPRSPFIAPRTGLAHYAYQRPLPSLPGPTSALPPHFAPFRRALPLPDHVVEAHQVNVREVEHPALDDPLAARDRCLHVGGPGLGGRGDGRQPAPGAGAENLDINQLV